MTVAALRIFRAATLITVAALLLALPAALRAQSLRGRVAFASNDAPLVGSIVQAREPNGAVVASALTSESGIYAFTGLANGTYSVRVLRIGFRAFEGGTIQVSNAGSATLNISWTGDPIPLSTQVVVAGRTCKISADSGKVITNVWGEARKVLMSSVLSEGMTAPELARLTYQRVLDSTGRFVRKQEVRNELSRSFRGYKSWNADSLATRGYMIEDESGATFYGPDATTLISESFAGAHCFFMVKGDNKHADDIGLRFEPATLLRNHVDIRGTFWIERKTWQLRSVEFLYTGLPSVSDDALSGGIVEFASLGSGQWFVDNWRIRMPRLGAREMRRDGGFDRIIRSASTQVLTSVEEAGGIVAKVSRDGKVLYERKLPTLSFRVISRDAAVPVAGAEVRVNGTDYVAVADSSGRAELRQLLDGRYTLSITLPALATLANHAFEKAVVIGTTDMRDSVNAPTPDAILRAACPDRSERVSTAVLFGSLRDSLGRATTGLVTVKFQGNFQKASSNTADARLGWSEETRGALANERGEFKVCDVPRRSIVVRAENEAGVDERFMRLADDAALVELTLQPRLVTTPSLGAADRAIFPTTATVEIRATDAQGRPIAGIQIEVENVNNKYAKATTDALGRALFLDQPIGRLLFHAVSGAISAQLEQNLMVGRNVLSLPVVPRR